MHAEHIVGLTARERFSVSKSRPKPATRRRSERQALTDEVNQHPAAVKAGGSGKEEIP